MQNEKRCQCSFKIELRFHFIMSCDFMSQSTFIIMASAFHERTAFTVCVERWWELCLYKSHNEKRCLSLNSLDFQQINARVCNVQNAEMFETNLSFPCEYKIFWIYVIITVTLSFICSAFACLLPQSIKLISRQKYTYSQPNIKICSWIRTFFIFTCVYFGWQAKKAKWWERLKIQFCGIANSTVIICLNIH